MSDVSANAVIKASIFSALVGVIEGYRARSGGVMNSFARDLAAIHSNTAMDDLPDDIQKIIKESTDEAFRRLLKEGYAVTPKNGPKKILKKS
jgi:hypothetical protein